MFRRPRDPGSTPGRTRKAPNLDPLECVDLLDDAGAAEASRATAAIIAPDQDSLDKACAGRCLCLCQCHFSAEETGTAAAAQGKKTKTGFIGTIRKKLGMRKKDADSENLSASPSPKSRARSPDRSVAHARSLPRSWKAVPSYSDRTVTIDVDLFVDDTCATTSRAKCRKPRSISQDKNIMLSPMKPRRSEKNDKTGTKLSRSGRLVAAPELLSDDDSKELLIQDTGYGHASAPNFNTCDTSPTDVVTCTEKEDDDNMACKIDSSQTVPLIPPVYDQVKEPYNGWSLTKELFKLPKYGWYWGPISRAEAEEKLYNQPDGSFLLRDSSDERYLLSLSFRSYGRTLHTRIEHCNGLFSFYAQTESEGYSSIVDLIEHSMSDSQSGVFCYSRARTPGSPSFPVRLAKAISRFTQVRSLQYLCRFVIRQYTRVDYIQRLPLPTSIKGWLEETQY